MFETPDYTIPGWTPEVKQAVEQAYAPFRQAFMPNDRYEFLTGRASYSTPVLAHAFSKAFGLDLPLASQIVDAFKASKLPEQEAQKAALVATKGFTNGRVTFA